MSRTTLRAAAALLIPCVVVLMAFAYVTWTHRATLRARLPHEQTEPIALAAVEGWARRPAAPGVRRGVIFADSLGYCADDTYVGQSLAQRLTADGETVEMLEIRRGAFRPLVYAYFLDDALAGRPQLAVIEVNVRLLSDAVSYVRAMRFLPLSRRLSLRRIWQFREALAADGLGLLDPLVYRVSERLDTLNVVAGLEAVGRDWMDAVDRTVTPAPGGRTLGAYTESVREFTRAQYVTEFADHPGAGVLREMRRALRDAGATVVFYVSPIPLHHLRRLGVLDDADLSSRIERLRVAIGATPREWVDLHALVDDERVFRDDVGHMYRPGCERIVTALAPRVQALLP